MIKNGIKLWILHVMVLSTFLVHGCPVFLFQISHILLLSQLRETKKHPHSFDFTKKHKIAKANPIKKRHQ